MSLELARLLPALILSTSMLACVAHDRMLDGGETSGDGDMGTGDGDGDGDPSSEACPNELFPAVSPAPENAAYPDPTLAVYCEGGEVIVESNGIPGYEFIPLTPNELAAIDWQWRFPVEGELAAETSEIPLLGPVGIAVNGLPVYGPNEGPFPDPYGDPVYNGIVDSCGGHTAMAGDYHYHTLLVECLSSGYGPDEPSPVIGFSFDGFPIYGSRGCLDAACSEVVEYVSGWVETGDPTTHAWDNHAYQGGDDPTILDPCNGHVGPEGDYHYHVTDGFPHVLGCYAGTATVNMGVGPGPMP